MINTLNKLSSAPSDGIIYSTQTLLYVVAFSRFVS